MNRTRTAVLALLAVVLIFNAYTLGLLSSDGRIDGIRRFYIWLFDLVLLLVIARILCRGRRGARTLSRSLLVLTLFIAVEMSSAVGFRMMSGGWHWTYDRFPEMFVAHPYLVGVPKPNVTERQEGTTISHNSQGWRGPEFSVQKTKGVKRIVAIGGSTTYCVNVENHQTWPHYLRSFLGEDWEVINLGVPGYSSVESLIQTALLLSDLDPDLVLYYMGWNDLHTMHVADLQADYSGFHGKYLYGQLNLPRGWTGPNLACCHYAVLVLQSVGLLARTPSHERSRRGEVSSTLDQRALSLYARNLSLLIALCRRQDITPIMIPQVLNYGRLTASSTTRWCPYVMEKDMKKFMAAYNQTMSEVAAEADVDVLGRVLAEEWEPSDFVDKGHFSPSGNQKFARLIASHVGK